MSVFSKKYFTSFIICKELISWIICQTGKQKREGCLANSVSVFVLGVSQFFSDHLSLCMIILLQTLLWYQNNFINMQIEVSPVQPEHLCVRLCVYLCLCVWGSFPRNPNLDSSPKSSDGPCHCRRLSQNSWAQLWRHLHSKSWSKWLEFLSFSHPFNLNWR